MYFPYLYGKQYELLAIRSLASEFPSSSFVTPVIEPVKLGTASLKRTLEVCERNGFALYIGINPNQLDFQSISRDDAFAWGRDMLGELRSRNHIRPTLIIEESTQRTHIRQFVREYEGRPVGVILRAFGISPIHISEDLGTGGNVKIFIHGAAPSYGTLAALGRDRCVWVEERFPHRSRNADYIGQHPFTDRHLNWDQSGLAGFSDFTVLPPRVSGSGGPPGAVALHMTYIELDNPADEVYVEHFVSDRQDQSENDNPGKMMEALAKFVRALRRTHSSFGLTQAAATYRERYAASNPPNLAVNKQLQITHHIELMHGLLAGDFPIRVDDL